MTRFGCFPYPPPSPLRIGLLGGFSSTFSYGKTLIRFLYHFSTAWHTIESEHISNTDQEQFPQHSRLLSHYKELRGCDLYAWSKTCLRHTLVQLCWCIRLRSGRKSSGINGYREVRFLCLLWCCGMYFVLNLADNWSYIQWASFPSPLPHLHQLNLDDTARMG
jgi:hypothetical protein